MEFFDSLSKRMTDVGQKTLQKTKDFSDIAKLNSMISTEEKKIDNIYYQMGKLYMSLHSDNYESNFADMIYSINTAEKNIQNYKNQIQNIKGVKECEKCGAEVLADSAFCSSCGAEMPKTQEIIPNNYIKCDKCGILVKKDMKFCTGCGNPIAKSDDEIKDTNSEEDVEVKCPNCGKLINDDSVFCVNCGERVK